MKHGKRIRRSGVILAVAAGAASALGSPAFADPFHNYTQNYEFSPFNSAEGVIQKRADTIPTSIYDNYCTTPFTGVPKYEDEWVQTNDAQNWVEFGTGFQCDGMFDYWFAAYGQNGNFYPIWTKVIPSAATHTFKIYHDEASQIYHWRLDDSEVVSVYWNRVFDDSVAGLESWDPNAYVPWYTGSYLQIQQAGRGWKYFDQSHPRVDPSMCQYKYNDATINFGENTC